MKRLLLAVTLALVGASFAAGAGPAQADSDAQISVKHPNKICAPVMHDDAYCLVRPRASLLGIRSIYFGVRWKHWGKRAIGYGKMNEASSAGSPGSGIPTTKAKIVYKRLKRCPSGIWKYTWRAVYIGPNYSRKYSRGGVFVDCERTWYLAA